MAQHVDSPPEHPQKQVSQPAAFRSILQDPQRTLLRGAGRGIIVWLVVIGLLLVLFSTLLAINLPQVISRSVQNTSAPQGAPHVLDLPSSSSGVQGSTASLLIPDEHTIVYEQQNRLYRIATDGQGSPQTLNTPGYAYNRAVPPILTPAGQLLYAGNGVWLTDIVDGNPKQIASLPANQVITSMVLSKDGTTLAWSTEPIDGRGDINLYAGPLDASTIVYQASAATCPCFRVFSFLYGPGDQGNTTLLLTDDRGDHHTVQNGLWALSLTDLPMKAPHQLLSEDPQQGLGGLQGPLTLWPSANTLLYSTSKGIVPAPTDGSAPTDIDSLDYANSLSIASIMENPPKLVKSQVIVAQQNELTNTAEYHWVATPQVSPDGQTLAYIVFSSDNEDPFDRHSSLYTVHVGGSGAQLRAGKPQLFSPSSSLFVELGPWLDNHILTFYADNALYAVDVQSKAIMTITQTKGYARIVAAF
ncbi:MAG TPA: hypothetical protein VKR06_01425 [Ktedonosporobacter sp.]|nr:hypothetical protein [Ktedonosporobacter sp.]